MDTEFRSIENKPIVLSTATFSVTHTVPSLSPHCPVTVSSMSPHYPPTVPFCHHTFPNYPVTIPTMSLTVRLLARHYPLTDTS